MQRRRFFIKRFFRYLSALVIPVLLLLLVAGALVSVRMSLELNRRAKDVLAGVETSLELSLNNIMLQNRQFANNPYTMLSLKRIFDGDELEYRDTLNLRTINATVRSTVLTYPYISSLYIYLDGYNIFYTSDEGIEEIDKEKDFWVEYYEQMPEDIETMAIVPAFGKGNDLIIYQRLLLQKGVVVMNINIKDYSALLGKSIGDESGAVLFYNIDGQCLFTREDNFNIANKIDFTAIPDDDKDGEWIEIDGKHYLIRQCINDIYNIRIVSAMPDDYLFNNLYNLLPYMLFMIAIAVVTILIVAYFSTKRNFRYIEQVIDTFERAEKGESIERRMSKTKDEYDVILNNIITMHLKTEQLNQQLVEKKQAQEVATLSALQTQINPHFMFNTLQMIKFTSIRETAGSNCTVAKMTEDLADILKYALEDPLKPITLQQEIDYLKKYVEIQKMRFGDKFIIYYEVDEGLDEFKVFRLMLQPIIENSILHGVRPSRKKGYIKLKIFKRDEYVYFRVFDTGIGMDRDELEILRKQIMIQDYHNVGLSNVNNRLILYFGEESSLKIKSRKNRGTAVEFKVPLKR